MIKVCALDGCEFEFELTSSSQKYCSKKCRNIAAGYARASIINQDGENNPNWKNGISKDNYHYKLIQKDRYPERVKARQIAYDAIRCGKIIKGRCVVCGSIEVQTHHENYDKPLDIMWLCREHHRQLTDLTSVLSRKSARGN